MTIEVKIPCDERGGIRHAAGFMPSGTHFEPQRASADYSWVIEFSLQSTSEIELARNGSKADCIS